ncbi:TerD family protein [uncultured Massilia sp.]|uniref:TerD family protein n=1 Tax=uncultured Massilia sp. TaxID=169973 RepID=UPI0025D94B34|nr:TerD family protein [uncultured Massilia sp.]
MHTFTRGQKGKLSDLGLSSRFEVAIDLQLPGAGADISCFGLDAGERLGDDRYMVFYNQLASPAREVTLALAPGRAVFQVDLDALPASIAKLVFTAALDGGGTMRDLAHGRLQLGDAVAFTLAGADFAGEKAVILAELYRRDGQWRFGAVGQGFDGGLAALLRHFGGVEAGPASSAPAAPAAPSAPAAAPASKVSLSKITLDKRGDKVSLDKRAGRGYGRIHVNLNWNRGTAAVPAAAPAQGFFGKMLGKAAPARGSGGIDLDLGCLYELADGTPGVIQALGKRWGSFDQRPFIALDGDDRTGAAEGGENMLVNGDRFDEIRRILVFALIYEGVANWAQTDGVVTIALPDQPTVEVRLDNGGAQRICGIAMIENRGGQLQVTKLTDYAGDQRDLDLKHGFGLRWKVGSKD